MNYAILPNLIALAVLVAVFWAISRKAISEHLSLWLAGWAFVLLHFAAQLFSTLRNPWGGLADILSIDCLVLAAVAFLVSVSGILARPRQLRLGLSLAVPSIAYVTAAVADVTSQAYYFALVAAGVLAVAICCRDQILRARLVMFGLSTLTALTVAVTAWAISRGDAAYGLIAILASLNFAIAILYTSSYPRISAGVVTTVTGFALWGAVFPLGVLLSKFVPTFSSGSEAWNIPKYLVAVGMILTLFEDQIETTRYHAYHDELTGLPNRRLLEDRLSHALTYARRANTKLAVFQLDLDRFKEVNDTYGHKVGDLALQEVASRLAGRIRAVDTLARSGGDEFTIISPVSNRTSAEALVAALEKTLSVPIVIDSREVQTGLSIGIALFPDDGVDADQLHAAADRAMYDVKRAARGVTAEETLTQTSAFGVANPLG
jgi:diguanylate cyclase (GGDEF)-like protein